MAELEGLYFGMGIDTSQLNTDFVNAQKTINQNLRRINQEMEMIQLRGQIQLDGLDESVTQLEKVRIQEEALTEQMKLQQDKILLLTKTYEYLSKTRGENAEVTRQVELQLAREQHAMEKLETQMQDLSKQTEIAFGVNFELLALIEPLMKKIDDVVRHGGTLPLGMAPTQAKVAAAAMVGLTSAIAGTVEATEELREANPANLVDEDLRRLSGSIDNSWQKINESNRRGFEQMRSYNRQYYNNNYQNNQNQYNQSYRNFAKEQDEQIRATKARTEQIQEIKKQTDQIGEIEKEQAGILHRFAKAIGVQEDNEGNLKILPDTNRNDILRFAKIFEDYRFSESLGAAMDLWKESTSVLGKLASTLTTVYFLVEKAQQPIAEFAQKAIENFRELSKAATELNLPLLRANDVLAKINLAGGDYNDVRDYVRGVQDAVIKGDSEDPEVLALEKYGVAIQDTNGKLLAFDETLDRLYQGYLKAREAGEAEAYVIMTNGQAVQDVLPYFEGLAQAEEDMAKIKWSTLDPATLKNASHEMKLFEVQTQELANAISSVLAPAAEMAFHNMFEDQKNMTELIEDHREEIIYWSYVLMEAIETVREFKKELTDGIQSKGSELGLMLKSFFADEPKKDIREEAKEYFIPFYKELKKLEEEFEIINKLENFLPEGFTAEIDNAINNYLVPLYEKIKAVKEEFSITNKLKNALSGLLPEGLFSGEDSIFARAQKDFDEYKKANEEARQEAKKTEEYLAGLSYSQKRIRNYGYELRNLMLDLEFGDDSSYQKKIEQNKIWYDKAMEDAKLYADEIAIINEVNAARLAKIEQERADKLQEIRDSVAAADKTALENKLDAIEKERQAWLKAGMDEVEVTELAEKKKLKAIQEAAEKAQQYIRDAADIEYSLTHTAFEKQLRDIERWKEEKIKAGEEASAVITNAAAKEAEAFEREVDRIKGKVQSLEDKIFAQEHSQYENDLRKLEQERYQLYQEGIYSPDMIERYYQGALGNLQKRATKGGDYTKSPEGAMQRGGNGIMVIGADQIIDDGKLNQSIGLIADENKIRAQLLPTLSEEGRERAAAIAANKKLADAQQNLVQQAAQGFQVIEGDKVVDTPTQAAGGIQIIESDQIVSGLQEFGGALQQTSAELEQFDPLESLETNLPALGEAAQSAADAQKSLAERLNDFPPEYFQQLADGTMKLIDAQSKLADALTNLPTVETTATREQSQQFGEVNLSSIIAPLDNIVQAIQENQSYGADRLQELFGTLPNIEAGVGSILQEMQARGEIETATQDYLPVLTSIDGNVQSVLQELQSQATSETTMTLETVITPLNNIEGLVQNILTALSNSQPPSITVSPSISNNLGGAYVFDNAMKQSLVDDITSRIVDAITAAVQQATSRSNYGYSA